MMRVNVSVHDAELNGEGVLEGQGVLPDILGASVGRAHDVTVVATDADTSGRIGHRARDRLGTHLDLQ